MERKTLKSATARPNLYRYASRYSNELPFEVTYVSDDYENLPDDYYSSNSTSGSSFDWGVFINNLLSSGTSIVKSIWGNDNKSQIQGLQYINEEQKKTTTILWVIIALMLALGVFIVIKKTK